MSMRVLVNTDIAGYLYARSPAASGGDYFALHVPDDRTGLDVIYRVLAPDGTSNSLKFLSFAFSTFQDDGFHTITTDVRLDKIILSIDGSVVGEQPLEPGPVADCGAASGSCITHVQQTGGGEALEGCVLSAELTTDVNTNP